MRSLYGLALAALLGAALIFPACNKGNTGPAGPAGNTGIPTPICSSPSHQGLASPGAFSTGDAGGVIYADSITLANPETATDILVNFAGGPVSGQVIMAVFTDSSGPNHLVYQTPPQNIIAGWDSAPIPDVYLPAGVYWLAFVFSNPAGGTWNNTGSDFSVSYGWGSLPVTFPAGGSTNTGDGPDAIYINTCP